MTFITRISAIILPLLALSACLLTPGKFTSTLDIRKDGAFTFTYKGEVILAEMKNKFNGMGDSKSSGDFDEADGDTSTNNASYVRIAAESEDEKAEDNDAKMEAIAKALRKEKGYRSVSYMGDNTFEIDYAISSKLDHSFVFPFNPDAEAPFPFLAIEVRAGNKVRIKAPGFASEGKDSGGGMGGMAGGDEAKEREGSFTLTTDAKIISQNQEDGAQDIEQGQQIIWAITPLTRTAPMAVLELSDQ